jgi:CRISPR-associated protein Csd1
MGLFQNLLETYDKCQEAIGIVRFDVNGEVNERKTLLPVFHTTFKSQICITIDENGNFINATRDNKDKTIIIPCTDSSAGRSSGVSAHPLCDQLDYVGNIDEKKFTDYINKITLWIDNSNGISKEKLNAIYNYVIKKSMIDDLFSKEIFKKEIEYIEENSFKTLKKSIDDKGKEELIVRKLGVRFRVEIKDDLSPNIWEDKTIRKSWINFVKLQNNQSQSKIDLFDYLSGEKVVSIAEQHPKNINSAAANAKLLSCNDTSGVTFRGRFSNQNEAIIVDYEQSQKMHQILKWLINNYGLNTDSQTIIIWAIDKDTKPIIVPYNDSFNLFSNLESVKTDLTMLSEAETTIYVDYSKKMNNYLQGYGKSENVTKHSRKICIAIFDAATTGRLGLTFYQELPEYTYLENIVNWHNDTSYFLLTWKERFVNKKVEVKPIYYIGAPSFDDILLAVYGKSKSKENLLKKKLRMQLLECMFGNFSFPKNIIELATTRASYPMSFIDANNSFSKNDWDRSVKISCALIRKYYKQKEEEISMELEEKRTDRDYLYGRLLAIADKLEQTALYKQGKHDQRATNAARLMSAFSVKPYYTWGLLFNQIIPYKNQLDDSYFYQLKINEVMSLFKPMDYENNNPLSPLYLLGYSAQMRALSIKKGQREDDKNVE